MDARYARRAAWVAAVLLLSPAAHAADHNSRTQNFIISAASPELAAEIGAAAERFRRDLAVEWLGRELPPWPEPCPVRAIVERRRPAGGATSFCFEGGQPRRWEMVVEGTRERVLDSVLPHEITHTIFATHFGRPLPRWVDEGACTTVEHVSERAKQDRLLIEFLTHNRGIAFNKMFAMWDYPLDVLPLYSQGYSLARFLIGQGGKRKYVAYVGDGLKSNNWTEATRKHYGYSSLSQLQVTWVEWVRTGSPPLAGRPESALAANVQDAPPHGNPTAAATLTTLPAQSRAQSTSQPRSIEVADATTLSGGWYARQRDLAVSARGQKTGARELEASAQSFARPPAMQEVQSLVLEPVATAPLHGTGQAPSRPRYDIGAGRTLRR